GAAARPRSALPRPSEGGDRAARPLRPRHADDSRGRDRDGRVRPGRSEAGGLCHAGRRKLDCPVVQSRWTLQLRGNRDALRRLPHRRPAPDIIDHMGHLIPLVPAARPPKPDWLKVRAPGSPNYTRLKGLMRDLNLHTVCEEAQCPNIGECWHHGTATFMILGDVCTRACAYCAIAHGRPTAADPDRKS